MRLIARVYYLRSIRRLIENCIEIEIRSFDAAGCRGPSLCKSNNEAFAHEVINVALEISFLIFPSKYYINLAKGETTFSTLAFQFACCFCEPNEAGGIIDSCEKMDPLQRK